MKKKQTAVEWFEQQLDDLDIEIPQRIFEQAKEIEKKQIIEFVDWLTKEDSPYAVLYGGNPERFGTLEEDFTIKEVYEQFLKSNI